MTDVGGWRRAKAPEIRGFDGHTVGRKTVAEPETAAANLAAALRRCGESDDWRGIYLCAVWLRRCCGLGSTEDLDSLALKHGLHTVTTDDTIQQLARLDFDGLASWCLAAVDQLVSYLPPEPSTWLPPLTTVLSKGADPLPAALRRVTLADMSLLTCSPTVLAQNAVHIRSYQTARAVILARASERN